MKYSYELDYINLNNDDAWVWMHNNTWEKWNIFKILSNLQYLFMVRCDETKEVRFVHTYDQQEKLEYYFRTDYLWRLWKHEV